MQNINELPRIDCDVFVASDSLLCIGEPVKITGHFYAENDCDIFAEVDAKSGVYLGDYSHAVNIHSEGDVIIGDFSHANTIKASGNVYLGDYSFAVNLQADGDVLLGYNASSYDITTGGDVLIKKKIPWKKLFKRFCREWER